MHVKHPLILLVILLCFSSISYGYQTPSQDNSNGKMSASVYSKIPLDEDFFYLDAPWRLEGENLTILGIWYYLGYVNNITFYDDFSGQQIRKTNYTAPVAVVDGPIFYSFTVNTSTLQRNASNYVSVRATFSLTNGNTNDEGPIYVYLANESRPSLQNWHAGDTHVHGIYSDNAAEFGASLNETSVAAREIGLEWTTMTEHTLSTRFENGWSNYSAECSNLTTCIRAAEISCSWFVNGTEYFDHYLGYNHTTYIHGGERFTDVNTTGNTLCSEVETRLNADNAFGYIAHPLLTMFLDFPGRITPSPMLAWNSGTRTARPKNSSETRGSRFSTSRRTRKRGESIFPEAQMRTATSITSSADR